ncbi:hypothetical protein KR054_004774 [Drosophila jambulina]|nr:hypothetical protein KR054_004774 [Drosophila jambulina]
MQRELAHNLATGERRTTDVAPGKVKTFSELNLRHEIVLGLQRRNFLTPTMIQAAAIPIALSRKDMLVQSKSGTGKTLIYAIAALQGLNSSIKTPQALVVVPTRELAVQVKETFCYVGEFLPNLRVSYFIGGTDVITDRKYMKNCRIVIGTPGRLLHLHKNNVLCLSNMNLLVLDEADQLYQQEGLHRHINELVTKMPRKMQKIACSATYEGNLDELLAKSMDKPVLISNSERATVLLGIRQFVYELPRQINSLEQMNCKLDAVMKIFDLVPYEQVVLFASSRMRADSFRSYLKSRGVECHLISGAMSQTERSEVFDCYRFFRMRTLVATDVFARGVDSPHTNLIVNLDLPTDNVDYLHRIGRAGRFGSKGIAITLVCENEESDKFKGILRKAHTGKSVLEFPKEADKGFDFWNFASYDFPYYIKEEENQLLQEFPNKEDATNDKAGDASLRNESLKEEKTLVVGDSSKKIEALKEVETLPDKNDLKNASNMLENGAAEEQKEVVNNDTQQFNSILVENAFKPIKPDKSSVKELILGKDSLKEQPPPIIKVTKLEMESTENTENNKENFPECCCLNNKSTRNPEEYTSPELTPSSLTPLDLTQEHTLTPPAPPVNSINNKTYCLAAPTATSSLTLQAMVISNTVDDASSISSDGSMGSRSESLSSLYSNTDVKEMWNKYLTIQRRLQRSAKIQTPMVMYNWSTYTPVSRVKRKREVKIQTPKLKWSIYKTKMYEDSVCLFLEQKYFRLIEKLEHSETIVKRLLRYTKRRKMSNLEGNLFLKLLYDAYSETFGFKYISEPKKPKENEPQNKLSVRVAHRMNIPPVPVAAGEDPATGSEANEASQHSEDFTDDEDDYEEVEEEDEEEGNSSSGFVESNESASSGIDTSEYDTGTSTEGDQEYEGSSYEEDDSARSLYGSERSGEELEWQEEEEVEDEDDYTGSNVSLAGKSYQSSEDLPVAEPEEVESEDEQSDTQHETLAMYQQMFQTQYQFIVAHVASHLARP